MTSASKSFAASILKRLSDDFTVDRLRAFIDSALYPIATSNTAAVLLLSSRFIQSDDYGTRASYLLAINHQGEVLLRELSYAPDGSISSESRFEFKVSDAASS